MTRPGFALAALLVALSSPLAHAQDFSTYESRADFVDDVLGGPDVLGSWGTYTLGVCSPESW